MNKHLHFSSKKDEWKIPIHIFSFYNEIYNFTLDPCATKENSLCEKFFTKEQDGLAQSWKDEVVFMNPPYGRQIGKWAKKAYEEAKNNNAIVVCLLPARTDTKWFWDYCRYGALSFLKGRLKFSNSCFLLFYTIFYLHIVQVML